MEKKIGVLLAGCGVYDGSEIQEAVLTLYFLEREAVKIICMAPDRNQLQVVNHQTSQETDETRNILVESARIARSDIKSLITVSVDEINGLIIPGGFGAAKNLINYAVKGRACMIHDDVKQLIVQMIEAEKPLGAICIAPVVVAVALQEKNIHPILTIGNDSATASDLEYFGAEHQKAQVDEIITDEANKIVTTPAYMLESGISDVALGIEKLVKQVVMWT